GARPAANATRLVLTAKDSRPHQSATGPDASELAVAAKAVAEDPTDRGARFALVQGLLDARLLEEALTAARAWRAVDAYNLVVVRLEGDILAELGRPAEALRVWSAVAELLPEDPQAHRALATVLKQSGDIAAAYERLKTASILRPGDPRIAFELGDAAARLDKNDEAAAIFGRIVADEKASAQIKYPAQRRLEQLKGEGAHDMRVYLTWDTDRTDVDLWVVNPSGQKVFYSNKKGRFGGRLYDDVTSGYGPEAFEAAKAAPGTYQVKVNYYGTERRVFSEARGEVVVVLAEGTDREQRHVLPYRLFKTGQTITVAHIDVTRPTRTAGR
ncbi:MAG: Ca-activated chloride channel family protein, partial [Myxococcota bacterium]